jgi:hypothetical protein
MVESQLRVTFRSETVGDPSPIAKSFLLKERTRYYPKETLFNLMIKRKSRLPQTPYFGRPAVFIGAWLII